MIHKGTTESGRTRILVGEAEQAEHAHNLRMLVEQQVDTLRAQYFTLYHKARDLKQILTQERTPMGFSKHELQHILAKLDIIERN